MRYVAGGANAKVVMGGLGSSAKQVWPVVSSIDLNLRFAITADLVQLPYQMFDGRTSELSTLLTCVVFSNMIQPQPNVAPTYELKLLDQKFNGASLILETVIPPQAKTLTYASMLVVSASADASNEVIAVEYGSNGVRIISLLGSTLRYENIIPYTIQSGSTLRVERFLSWIKVYVDDIPIGAATHPSFNLVGLPGVGVFSSAEALSTPIGSLKIWGGTSSSKTKGGMGFFQRGGPIPRQTSILLMRFIVPGGGTFRAISRNIRWNENGGWNRNFTLKMNDSDIGVLGGPDGTDYVASNPFTVPEQAIFSVVAWNIAVYDYGRIVKSGSVEIVPA